MGVPLSVAVSLGAAMLLNARVSRFKAMFRTALFAPVVTTLVAVAVIWRYLFHTTYGLVNWGLGHFGIGPVDWLGDPSWAMPTIIRSRCGRTSATTCDLLAGLQSIPQDLYEAAASTVRRNGGSSCSHPADAGTGVVVVGVIPLRLLPAVRRTLCDDPGRSAAEHGQRAVFHVEEGFKW